MVKETLKLTLTKFFRMKKTSTQLKLTLKLKAKNTK